MAGVGGVMKLVRQVIGNWKVGKNCELKLNCESGVMKVTMTADLGSWIQPTSKSSESGNSVHQGPRRRAGPSYLRRQQKRATERVAAAAAAAAEQTAQEETDDVDTVSPAAPATPVPAAPPGSQQAGRTCKKCGQPCRGHTGPPGARCSDAPINTSTPEKLRGPSSPSTSILTTPAREEARAEDCWNCGEVMSPTHQCGETPIPFKVIHQSEAENIMACKCREGHKGISCFDSTFEGTSDFECHCTESCKLKCYSTD